MYFCIFTNDLKGQHGQLAIGERTQKHTDLVGILEACQVQLQKLIYNLLNIKTITAQLHRISF